MSSSFSDIEARVMAHLNGDEPEDAYNAVALDVCGKVTPATRQAAKTATFIMLYGGRLRNESDDSNSAGAE